MSAFAKPPPPLAADLICEWPLLPLIAKPLGLLTKGSSETEKIAFKHFCIKIDYDIVIEVVLNDCYDLNTVFWERYSCQKSKTGVRHKRRHPNLSPVSKKIILGELFMLDLIKK